MKTLTINILWNQILIIPLQSKINNMNLKVVRPKHDVNIYFVIDGNGDGTFQIELWNDIEMRGFGTNKDYIRQYLTYLVVGGFIEVGKYRTMGNLYHYDDRVEVKYSVCKEVNDDPQGDDVWVDVKSKFRFK